MVRNDEIMRDNCSILLACDSAGGVPPHGIIEILTVVRTKLRLVGGTGSNCFIFITLIKGGQALLAI